MRIHTLAGDVIDLRFLWPLGTMHKGRQAARAYAERAEQVVIMRRDPEKQDGTEALVSSRMSADGTVRIDTYSVVPGLTPVEREIPMDELFVRDKQAPMINTESDLVFIPTVVCTAFEPDLRDTLSRSDAITARFLAHILSALSNNPKAP